MRTVICDIETNGLTPTKVWCVVAKDVATNEVFTFTGFDKVHNVESFNRFVSSVTCWIGHNFLCYDRKWLNRLLGTDIKVSQVVDTYILSMLFNVNRELVPGIRGRHSLERWGALLGLSKPVHEDWSAYSDAMLERCRVDVEINHKVYKRLLEEGKEWSKESVALEHNIQFLLDKQQEYGFYFDQRKAHSLLVECTEQAEKIRAQVVREFLPEPYEVREVTPKYKKDGELSLVGIKGLGPECLKVCGGSFTAIAYQEFNPNSPSQVVDRLNRAGWQPVLFNKVSEIARSKGVERGSPKICEENLATLPSTAPEGAKQIAKYLLLDSRVKNIKTWFEALGEDGRIHGTVIGCGAASHRAAHRNPNTANIPKHTNKAGQVALYGKECRECWTVKDDSRRLVGVDAAGIQLRVLAHYMGDDSYTSAIVRGRKEDGSDVHTINQKAAGLQTRDIAKTFIYALLLGAGNAKLGSVMKGSAHAGAKAKAQLLAAIPALSKVMQMAEASAKRGWMERLDGGRLQVPSAHKALAWYLQAGEAVIMKRAYVYAYTQFKLEKLDANIVAWVHDEYQIDCAKMDAQRAGEIACEAIRLAGESFYLKCPMAGEMRIGQNWNQTH